MNTTTSAISIQAPPAAIDISPIELRIVLAYRNMDAETQRMTFRMAEHCATIPSMSRRKAPVFQLITGGMA